MLTARWAAWRADPASRPVREMRFLGRPASPPPVLKISINWEKAFTDLPTADPAGAETAHRRAVQGA